MQKLTRHNAEATMRHVIRTLVVMTIISVGPTTFSHAAENGLQPAVIGKATIQLAHPSEFCSLDGAQPADNRVLSMLNRMLAGRNKLLAAYALCDELPDWRVGKKPLLTDLLQFQTVVALMNRDIPKPYTTFRKQFCGQFRTGGQALIDKVTPEVNERIARTSENIEVNQQRIFGVVAAPEESCYVLLLQKIKAETGATFTQLAVLSPIIIKSKMVFAYLFVRFDPAAGGQPTVDRLKKLVAKVKAANGIE